MGQSGRRVDRELPIVTDTSNVELGLGTGNTTPSAGSTSIVNSPAARRAAAPSNPCSLASDSQLRSPLIPA